MKIFNEREAYIIKKGITQVQNDAIDAIAEAEMRGKTTFLDPVFIENEKRALLDKIDQYTRNVDDTLPSGPHGDEDMTSDDEYFDSTDYNSLNSDYDDSYEY